MLKSCILLRYKKILQSLFYRSKKNELNGLKLEKRYISNGEHVLGKVVFTDKKQ